MICEDLTINKVWLIGRRRRKTSTISVVSCFIVNYEVPNEDIRTIKILCREDKHTDFLLITHIFRVFFLNYILSISEIYFYNIDNVYNIITSKDDPPCVDPNK